MTTQRTTLDNKGIVYLFTNDLYEKENTYKFGNTKEPFRRNGVQKNSTPPTHPFYKRIVIFSSFYIDIEKDVKKEFKTKGLLLKGKGGGNEWIRGDYNLIVQVFKSVVLKYPDAIMCYDDKCFQLRDGYLRQRTRPNCRLDILGILNGDKITCIQNNKTFEVKNNKILVDGKLMTLSNYMKINYTRNGQTNQYDGYKYFKYKGKVIYELWQSLVRPSHE